MFFLAERELRTSAEERQCIESLYSRKCKAGKQR
jgi:hypothetical protein